MAPTRSGVIALAGLLAGPAFAECAVENLVSAPHELSTSPPAQLDLALRPVLPKCLDGLSGPEKENCPRGEIADYGAAIDVWVGALSAYVADTNRFANEVTVIANSAIDHAREARNYADAALEFANCEVAAINAASEE